MMIMLASCIPFPFKMPSDEMNDVDASTDLKAVCYLCLDGGVDDEDGQPLRRDCAQTIGK
jgi:hypothetical protein